MKKQKNQRKSSGVQLRKSQFKEKYWRDATEKDCGKLMIARFRDEPMDGWYYSILLRYGTVPDNLGPGPESWVSYAEAGYESGWATCQVYDPPKRRPRVRGRLVTATADILNNFSYEELKTFAKKAGVRRPCGTKFGIISDIKGLVKVRVILEN